MIKMKIEILDTIERYITKIIPENLSECKEISCVDCAYNKTSESFYECTHHMILETRE